MIHVLVILVVAVGGVAVGSLGHAWLSKEVAATKVELKGWAQRMRTALDADVATGKADLKAIVAEIEKKL